MEKEGLQSGLERLFCFGQIEGKGKAYWRAFEKQVGYFNLVDLTESFKNQSKDYGLDMMDSKKPLAVFTQGKSIIKAVL